MNLFPLYIIALLFSLNTYAQIENKKAQTIDFSGLSKKDDFPKNENNGENLKKEIELPETPNFVSPESFSGLNYESKIDRDNFGTLNPIKMDFGVAPTVNKYITNDQPNYLKKEKGISVYFQRDQKLGDIITKSKFLIIKFRDYGNIDGDIVRLIINDKEIVHRAILGSDFSQIKINLDKDGFYKIDFMALNMGQLAPNTAQLKIVDDNFDTILNDKWALSTGFKATLIVIKE